MVSQADEALLLTTPEAPSIDGLYALVRGLNDQAGGPPSIRLLLNDVRRPEEAALLSQVVEVLSARFGVEARPLELIPHDPQLWIAGRRTGGPLAAGPSSALGPTLAQIATALEPLCQEG